MRVAVTTIGRENSPGRSAFTARSIAAPQRPAARIVGIGISLGIFKVAVQAHRVTGRLAEEAPSRLVFLSPATASPRSGS